MEISIKWFDGQYPSFNVSIASKEGKEPFVEIKGCRIAQGKDGEFVATPSTKNEKTGKYWNHAYFSKDFAAVVLEKAKESQTKQQSKSAKQQENNAARQGAAFGADPFDSDIPFMWHGARGAGVDWRSM